jgi:hypothetical protein
MTTHLQCGCGSSKSPCGCCEGVAAVTPLVVANRPGLDSLAYRVGTHATFLETMLARLTTMCLGSEEDCRSGRGLRPLQALTTREPDDPSIALLDAWATVADVLTFYQERIANEGYLRTASERRSIIELARLVGYRLRPGVAASVWLSLTVEDGEKVSIEPYEVRAQSVPGPGELPQTFENIEKIDARGEWNNLVPRKTRPQDAATLTKRVSESGSASIYLKGIATGVNPGDPLLVTSNQVPALFRAIQVNTDSANDRTDVVIEPWFATATVKSSERLTALVAAFQTPGAAAPQLKALSAELEAGRTDAELADFIERETLPGLERVAGRRNISSKLRERVRVLSDDLVGSVEELRASAASTSVKRDAGEIGSAITARAVAPGKEGEDREDRVLRAVVDGLTKKASIPPRNTLQLGRNAAAAFQSHSDLGIQAFGVFQPTLLDSFATALGVTPVTPAVPPQVFAFRVKASPFGHNAPQRTQLTATDNPKITEVSFFEWAASDVRDTEDFFTPSGGGGTTETELTDVVYLDGSFDKVLNKSWVVVDTSGVDSSRAVALKPVTPPLLIARAGTIAVISRSAYGLSGKATRLELAVPSGRRDDAAWMEFNGSPPIELASSTDDFQIIRRTVIYAQAELLPLTEEPIEDDICTTAENGGWIVLDGVYSELKSGRWVVVEGERADILDGFGNPVTGVKGSELAMLADVVHDIDSGIPGDAPHTRIKLAADLEYCYTRETVTIYANVVKATHGETRKETLGNGDGTRSLQSFALKQTPLTYVSAPTASGIGNTLKVFVNDVEWHEAESIFGLQSTDRRFTTSRSDAEITTVIFGNGKQGARLPTGSENTRAQYRQGLGKAGNVAQDKITILAARPLSVKEVTNPRRASGGADPETRDQARKNAPLAVLALDRLVSVSDYADFARTFGGVGKGYSLRLSDGVRELVHVTIAGADDAPIEDDSDVLRNLRLALTQFGDPALPVQVAVRELLLLVVSANVRLLPDYVWEKVAPQIRARMLEVFGFQARELGQDVFLSEVISTIQAVPGVAYVDVDSFGGIAERNADGSVRTPNELIEAAQLIVAGNQPQRVQVNLPEVPKTAAEIRPAQLAYLVPEVPDTLILNLIE